MPKKFSLPLLSEVFADPAEGGEGAPKKPGVDVARKRLGGRVEAEALSDRFLPGQHVVFERSPGEHGHGVVLHASATEIHVLLDPTRLRRFAPGELSTDPAAARPDLAPVAADARVFGLLTEGQEVRYADGQGTLREGRLVERCRYGALVLRHADGVVVAVGFRKLWPAPALDGVS